MCIALWNYCVFINLPISGWDPCRTETFMQKICYRLFLKSLSGEENERQQDWGEKVEL